MAIFTALADYLGRTMRPFLAKYATKDYREVMCDASGYLKMVIQAGTSIIGKIGHDKTGIGHGVKVVATAGTHLALAASTPAKVVIIQAQTDNTSGVAVGGDGVDATVATGTGILLYAGDSAALEIDNLADVYVDALVSGEGVRYTYLT